MPNNFVRNSIAIYCLFSLVIFVTLEFSQNNNALPFFYKDYPTYQTNGKKHFDLNSERLVLNRIDFSTRGIDYPYRFNLWRTSQDSMAMPDHLLDGTPYQSQIGAQAWFWAKLAERLDIRPGDYRVLKNLSVLFVALSSSMLLAWMKVNFGTLPSLAGLGFLILSTGVNVFAPSLYWSLWLFMLPLAVVCLLDILDIQNRFLIFIATLPVFFVKFLCGYEFISVIVLAAMTPYAWNFFVRQNTSAAFRALSIGASSMCAFLLSLLYYNGLFSAEFGLSGIDYLLGRSESWSVRNLENLGLSPWTQAVKILVMNFIDLNGYGVPLGVCLISIALAMACLKNRIRAADMGFMLFLLLGSSSWIVIQPGHLLFHPRYATLVFSLPFGLFAVGFLARLFDSRNRLKKDARALLPS